MRKLVSTVPRRGGLRERPFLFDHRPLTHQKWITMLAEAGFHVIERRTLAEIKALVEAKPTAATLDAWAPQPQEVEG
ncbi:MAG: hypothetical protein GYA24_24445 [Candidatus Lokiarchaeota archaeon]|nr:hypothetical protein [Candidatus Lokiarchaeota archaeon]